MRRCLRSTPSYVPLLFAFLIFFLLPMYGAYADVFMGVPVEPLGAAEFAAAPDDTLKVKNLGSSGMDGFSCIMLDVCNHWDLEVLNIDDGPSSPVGALLDISFWKYAESAPDSLLGRMLTEKIGVDTWSLSVDYPYASYRLEAWNDDSLVWYLDGFTGPATKFGTGPIGVGTITWDGTFPKNDFHGNYAPIWTEEEDVVYTPPGPWGPFMIDALKVIPEGGPGACPPMSRVDVLASGISEITVTHLAASASIAPDVDIDIIQWYDAVTGAPDSPYIGQYVTIHGDMTVVSDTFDDNVIYVGSVDAATGKPSGIRVPDVLDPPLGWEHGVDVSGVVSTTPEGEIVLLAPSIAVKDSIIPKPIPTYIPGPEFQDEYEYVGAFVSTYADSVLDIDGDRVLAAIGGNEIIIYVEPGTGIDPEAIPEGLVEILGIGVMKDGAMMLMPRSQDDIRVPTPGEIHNQALQYIFDHEPVFDSPVWWKQTDVQTIQALLVDFCVDHLGMDRPYATGIMEDWFFDLGALGMFFDHEGTTYYGSPVVSDEFIPYVMQDKVAQGELSQALADSISAIAEMTNDRCDCGTLVQDAVLDLEKLSWGSGDAVFVELFVDIWLHSHEFWTAHFSAAKASDTADKVCKIAVADATLGAKSSWKAAGDDKFAILTAIYCIGAAASSYLEYGEQYPSAQATIITENPTTGQVHTNTALPNSSLDVQWRDLVVYGTSPGDEFGLAVPMNGATAMDMHLGYDDGLWSFASGSYVEGTFYSEADVELGVMRRAANYDGRTELSFRIGQPPYHVEAYLGQELVFETSSYAGAGHGGLEPLGMAEIAPPTLPLPFGFKRDWHWGMPSMTWDPFPEPDPFPYPFPDPIFWIFEGGFAGDVSRVVFYPEIGSQLSTPLGRMEFRANGLAEFLIPYISSGLATSGGLGAAAVHLAQDAYPTIGVLDTGNLCANSVRFDMAANIAPREHLNNTPGDSICIDAAPTLEGAAYVHPPRMYYKVRANPLFDSCRTAGGASFPEGYVDGIAVVDGSGDPVLNRWCFDLPDEGFLFPGDVMHYYFETTESNGMETLVRTLPDDITGFSDVPGYDGDMFAGTYPDQYRFRALPTYADGGFGPERPPILVVYPTPSYDLGDDMEDLLKILHEILEALRNLGYRCGVDFDLYCENDGGAGMGNGLGGRATLALVEDYDTILYFWPEQEAHYLDDHPSLDAGAVQDIELLDLWLNLGGRNLFLAGNHLASDLGDAGTQAVAFRTGWLKDKVQGRDIHLLVGNMSSSIEPRSGNSLGLVSNWMVQDKIGSTMTWDAVEAEPGGEVIADFLDTDGDPITTPYAAGILNADPATGSNVVWLPYAFPHVGTIADDGNIPSPIAARTLLLEMILLYFGHVGDPGSIVEVPDIMTFGVDMYPNPFNAQGTLVCSMPERGRLEVNIYNTRGQLVRTLFDDTVEAGRKVLNWDGRDDTGRMAASRVYLYRATGGGKTLTGKLSLVK